MAFNSGHVNPDHSDLDRLSPAQRAAMAHVEAMVRSAEVALRPTMANLLQRAGCSADTYGEAMECVRLHGRVVIHFHPDRLKQLWHVLVHYGLPARNPTE